jgi:hypothetical protein
MPAVKVIALPAGTGLASDDFKVATGRAGAFTTESVRLLLAVLFFESFTVN